MSSLQNQQSSTGGGVFQAVASLRSAYERLPMSPRRYLGLYVAPAAVLGCTLVVVAVVLSLPGILVVPVGLLALLLVGSAVIYPKLHVEQRAREIETKFHLLITHMTVLSTTNTDRMSVFRTLADEEEYGALAEEIRRTVQLVDTWNQSLDEACRRRARQAPSKVLADYLDRLSYSLGAGQDLSDFLLNEQQVIMDNFVTVYRGSLNNLEVLKDLYLSMVLSMTFGLVFAIVLPILTGTDPTIIVSAVIVMYVFVQVGFFQALRTVTTDDPVWYHPEDTTTDARRFAIGTLAAGAGLSTLLIVAVAVDQAGSLPIGIADLLGWDSVPLPVYAAIPTTPLLLPGIVLRMQESRIKDRDKEFPSFIRALGASESAKQSTTSAVLDDLRRKDFGALSVTVDNLYKRLNMRLDPVRSWNLFAIESQSYLIQKFSDMYLEGRQLGGDPKQLGELISENANTVLQLRERRAQETTNLIGVLYGITAASTFALFIGLKVVELLSGLSIDLTSERFDFGSLIHTATYNIPQIEFLLTMVILFNALLSAFMIRTVDGGNLTNSALHFVVLTWLGTGIAVVTQWVAGSVISI